MSPFWSATRAEFKRFVREPPANFLALGMPLLALFVLGVLKGNITSKVSPGYGATDLAVPGVLTVITAVAGFIVAPAGLAAYRRRGLLEPGAANAPALWVLLAAQVLVDLTVATVSATLVVVMGRLLFGLRPPAAALAAALAFWLGCCTIVAVGYLLSGLMPTPRLARAAGGVCFALTLLFSGAAVPAEVLPAPMRSVSIVLPMAYVRFLITDLWVGRDWNALALGVVAATLALAAGVSTRLYPARRRPALSRLDAASPEPTGWSLQDRYAPANRCFGCGPANEKGLRIKSRVVDGEVIAEWTPEPHHEAFTGMLSDGIICALLDCHSNWTAAWQLMTRKGLEAPPCTVTSEFQVKLQHPTPSGGPVALRARLVAASGDRATVEATLEADGRIMANSRGIFVAVAEGSPGYHRW